METHLVSCSVAELDSSRQLGGIRGSRSWPGDFDVLDFSKLGFEDRVVFDSVPADRSAAVRTNFEEACVKGAIDKGRQTDAVAGVGANILVVAPRNDMGCHQELAGTDACDGALPAVVRLDGLRKDTLGTSANLRSSGLILDAVHPRIEVFLDRGNQLWVRDCNLG